MTPTELEGLKRKLNTYLAAENELLRSPWEVGECVGTWVRPNFDDTLYPYTPPHITRPKEVRKLFVIALPERAFFGVRWWLLIWHCCCCCCCCWRCACVCRRRG